MNMDELAVIQKTRDFVKKAFQENPHYSFNDWHVMYDHSCRVEEIARKIAESVPCDSLVVSVGALLHDIGKTHKADAETLHRAHESFNVLVSEEFLDGLGLEKGRLAKIRGIISYSSDTDEMKIIKDADALALPSDKRLYMLFIEWAHREKLESSIQRKLDKKEKLRFEVSREMAEGLFENMAKDFEEYKASH